MQKEGDRWRAYDVVIEGVSLVSNYRSQFNRIIQQSGYGDAGEQAQGQAIRARVREQAEGEWHPVKVTCHRSRAASPHRKEARMGSRMRGTLPRLVALTLAVGSMTTLAWSAEQQGVVKSVDSGRHDGRASRWHGALARAGTVAGSLYPGPASQGRLRRARRKEVGAQRGGHQLTGVRRPGGGTDRIDPTLPSRRAARRRRSARFRDERAANAQRRGGLEARLPTVQI